jgi:hypothetical protein
MTNVPNLWLSELLVHTALDSTRSNCTSSKSSRIELLVPAADSDLNSSSHRKVLVTGEELQAAEYEALKAAQEALETEKKTSWKKTLAKARQGMGTKGSSLAGNCLTLSYICTKIKFHSKLVFWTVSLCALCSTSISITLNCLPARFWVKWSY